MYELDLLKEIPFIFNIIIKIIINALEKKIIIKINVFYIKKILKKNFY